ncbi:MAG: EF-hand domain-containing protein, partial [Pseudomonadota bacterium]
MNTRKTISSLAIVAAIGSAVLATAAHSEQLPTRGPMPFSAYDQNGDGVIGKKEFDTVREKLKAEGRPMRNALTFTDLDQNRDDKITAEEFAAAHTSQAARPRGPGMGGGMQGNMPEFSDFDLNK